MQWATHRLIQQIEMMARMCEYHHLPDKFTMYPVNSPGVLVHWRVLLLLAACLEEEDRIYWINRFQILEVYEEFERIAEVAEPEPSYPKVYDLHFHLVRVLRDFGMSRSGSVEDVWRIRSYKAKRQRPNGRWSAGVL